MRVALVTPAPTVGGVTRHLFDLALGVRARGDQVVVGLRSDADGPRRQAHALGLDCVDLAQAARLDCDVWHLHLHNTLDVRVLPLLAARRARGRSAVLLTEHLPRVTRTDPSLPLDPLVPLGRRKPGAAWLKLRMKEVQYRLCDAVIAVSDGSAAFLSDRYRIPAERLHVVVNGVAVPGDAPEPRAESGPPRVMSVGALDWRKGLDVLIDACGRAGRDWTLTIVGDGPHRDELRRLAAGVPQRTIEFTGWVDDAAHVTLDADISCVPSRSESFGYVVVEAMACARPVVASAVDGVAQLVADGETGLLVPPDDPRALAAALDALAHDPERRRRMGVAAHARAARHFTLQRMVDATASLYERCVSLRSSGRQAGRSRPAGSPPTC